MLHPIREAMKETGSEQPSGIVEIDERFIGGKVKNMHKNQRTKGAGHPGKLS